MARFKPTKADMRETIRALERAEKKWKLWREEGDTYNGMLVNDIATINANAPGGDMSTDGRSETSTIYRNGIRFAVWAAMRRKQIKNPRFEAVPEISMIQRDTPEHGVVDVESSHAAYAQGELLTYICRKKRLSDNLLGTLEQGEIYDEGWLKCVTWNGADAPETLIWCDSSEAEESETSVNKIKSRRPVNSLANDRYPSAIFVSNEDVIPDADANCDAEMNRITHRCVKPLVQMKNAEIDDYEMFIEPESGILKSRPVVDEMGNPKKRKKYMNLDGLSGNYEFYLDKRYPGRKKDGDVRNYGELETDFDPKDGLVFFEENGRFPADCKIVEDEFGGIPKTIDGFVYFWKCYVEQTSEKSKESDEGPTLIRWDWYPVDMGGFALERYCPIPKAGCLRGPSWIRDAKEALETENYWESYDLAWYSAQKPVNIWNTRMIDPNLVTKIQAGDHFDNILADVGMGASLRDAHYRTDISESPQGVQMLKARMRMIQDEASGASANQRLQAQSDVSATQSGIVAENANDQTQFDIDRVKDFVERVGKKLMRLFRATLPANGRYEVPGSEGAFVQFDAMQLDIDCVFRLDYSSFSQQPNPVETKQLGELTNKIANTPPQLWEKMMPFWEVEASRFTPAVMNAFRKFQKGLGNKPDTDPMKEHILMREGQKVEPDQNENFIETIPQHQKMLADVMNPQSPVHKGWNTPAPNGIVPRQLLSYHLAKSSKIAVEKGMGPALGLQPNQAGMQRKQGGSAQDSGRLSQAPPTEGGVEAGVNSVEGVSA